MLSEPLVDKNKSRLQKKILGLSRARDAARDSRRFEGVMRERLVAFFGNMKGYHTEWKEINGWNYLYDEDVQMDNPRSTEYQGSFFNYQNYQGSVLRSTDD